MSFRGSFPRPLRAWAADALPPRGPTVLAASLVVALVLFAPLFAVGAGRLSLSFPVPLLVGVAVVGGTYGAVVLLSGEYLVGVSVALIVTATFAADLPLTAGADSYPGSLGPELWLVHGPLLVLLGLLAIRGEFSVDSLSPVEYALGAFVAWSVVVAAMGPVPRPDTALYYSLFSLVGLLAFAVARRSVEVGALELAEFVRVILIAVFGHVVFALAQVANGAPFGFSVLGETTRSNGAVRFDVGPLGELVGGVSVSGFTGGSGPLSMLVVFALPATLAVALRQRGRWRAGALIAAVVAAGVLRATAKDGARGAAIVGGVLFGGYLLWTNRSRVRGLVGRPRWLLRPAAVAAALVSVLLYPSTLGSAGRSGARDGGAVAGGGTELATVVPFFDLSTLGVRLAQYVVALDIAIRHPVFGVGGANFVYAAAEYGVPGIEGFPVHDLYLSLLVGTGIPGFLLYCLAVTLVLWRGWRLLRSEATDPVLVAGVLAGLLGGLAALLWVIPIRFTYAVPFWLLAGALVGEAGRVQPDGRAPPTGGDAPT